MSLAILEMPEEQLARIAWLERRLLDPGLATLAAELSVIHGAKGALGASLESVLGPPLADVCRVGLGALSDQQLECLLSQPALLLELQERVLMEGGPYWDNLLHADAELSSAVERGRQRLERLTQPQPEEPAKVRPARPARNHKWDVQTALLMLATAAAVMVCMTLWQHTGRSRGLVAWGWERPGALRQETTRRGYLTALADAAEQWFEEEPNDADALGKRIGQMRQGCTTLLLSKHAPLNATDQAWLKERCRNWAKKLDADLATLEGGEEPGKVRASVDATVRQLVRVLREKAQTEEQTVRLVPLADREKPNAGGQKDKSHGDFALCFVILPE